MAETVGSVDYEIDVHTGDLLTAGKQVDRASDKMVSDFGRVEKSTKNLNTQVTKTSAGVKSALSGVGKSAGQAGIQLQQFIGQIQGGQNALTALSQQSADLGIVLNAPLVGAFVSITAAIVSMSLAAGEATENVEGLADAASQITDLRFQNLVDGADALRNIRDESDVTQVNQYNDAILRATVNFENQALALDRLRNNVQKAQDQLSEDNWGFDDTEKEQEELRKATEEYNEALERSAELQSEINRLQDERDQFVQGVEDENKQLAAQSELFEKLKQQAQAQLDLLRAEKDERGAILATQALGNDATQEEIDQLAELINQRFKLNEQLKEEQAGRAAAQRLASGVLGRGQTTEERLAAELEKLQAFREQDLIEEELYQQTKTGLERQASEERQRILDDEQQARIDSQIAVLASTSDLFGGLAGLTSAFAGEQSAAYKVLFGVSQAFAVAQAALNLSLALSQALADPTALTLPQKLANYAAIASAGGALLSNIASVSFGGGRQFGGPVEAGNLYRVGEGGAPEIYQAGGKNFMIPGEGGKVLSNDQAFGAQTININNMAPGVEVEPSVSNDGRIIDIAVKRAVSEVSRQAATGQGQFSKALRTGTNTTFRAGGR